MESKPHVELPYKELVTTLKLSELTKFYNQLSAEINNPSITLNIKNTLLQQLKDNISLFPFDPSLYNHNNQKDIDIILLNKNYTITSKEGKHNLLFYGYPSGNLLLLLINNILLSIHNKSFPFTFYPIQGFSEKTTEPITNLNTIFQTFSLSNLSLSFLDIIKERGVLTLLGLRETTGSINTFIPPSIDTLSKHFLEQHTKENPKNPKVKISILTVGARALCKHSHRASEGFWPEATGKEIQKNKKAEEMLKMFYEKCIWINIHGLPHEIAIIELRVDKGYGIRWQIDGMFRGFLEPQMEDGHEKGWRH